MANSIGDAELHNRTVNQVVLHENYPLRKQDEDFRVEPERIDEDTTSMPKPLHWYHWLWASLPMLLVFKSVILGVFLGLAATHWNVKILQSRRNTAVKFLMMLGVMGTAVAVHFLIYGPIN